VPVSAIGCAEWYRLQLQVVTWVVIPSSPRRDLFSKSHYVEKTCQAGVWPHVLFSPHIILYYPPGMDSRAKLTGSPDISGVLGSYVRPTHTTEIEIWGSNESVHDVCDATPSPRDSDTNSCISGPHSPLSFSSCLQCLHDVRYAKVSTR